MGKWNIYHKDGSVLTDVNDEQVAVHGLEYSDSWMGECFVSIDFKRQSPIGFEIGDYIIYRGERFELNYDPGKEKQARINTYGDGFVYDGVKFNALQDELSRAEFLDVVLHDNQLHYTTLPKFPFYVETVDDLLDRIQANLDEQIGEGKWKIFSRNKERSIQRGCTKEEWNAAYGEGTTDSASFDSKSITIDTQKCWDALALVNTEWDINFIVRGRNVYVGTAGVMTQGVFKYGLGNGLYKVDQNADSDQSIITRLRAYGSEKNLPNHYYADLGIKYVVGISKVVNATSYVELNLDLDYISTYFTEPRKYIASGSAEQINGWVLRVTFDFKTVITGYVDGMSDNKCLFYSELKGSQADNDDEVSKDDLDAFIAQVNSGEYSKLYIVDGINEKTIPSENKEYAENLPNNMAISRLMLPGFPTLSLKEFWDTMTDEERRYVNPTGKKHKFSEDKYRPYIDSINIEQIGLRSGSQFFDTDDKKNGIIDIYPTIEEMEIGGVRVDEIYTGTDVGDDGRYDTEAPKNIDIYLDPAIDFDINDLREDDFSINMKDGMCGGRTFKVASCTKENGSWRLTIERVKDDAMNLYFPYKDYQINKGDHFVLAGIKLPDSYVRAASLKLLKYAIALLDKNDYTRYVYQPKVDEIFMARQHDAAVADKSGATKSLHDTLKAGDIMQFEDDDFGINASVTIDQLSIKEEEGKIPTYEITLREDKEVGTIQKIQQQISSLESGNGVASEPTIAQVKSMFKSEGGRYFLSKLSDDIANGFITFAEGIAIGTKKTYNIFKDGIAHLLSLRLDGDLEVEGSTQLGKNGTSTSFGDFNADSTGARISVGEDGTSTAEFDYINVRRAAQFREITIKELRHIGGELAISAAAMVCSKVERLDASGNVIEEGETKAFRCYFDTSASDGAAQKVFQQFKVGDQARCQQFGLEGTTEETAKCTRYYWRLVTEVGDDYIVLSGVDKDPLSTVEPQAGDNIVQLGYRYEGDTSRQSAIILSATSGDAPSAKYYQGINDYSLNHIVKDEGYENGAFHSNVYGNSYTGDKEGNSYFSYDAVKKTATFKGKALFTHGTELPDGTAIEDVTTKKDLENFNIRSGNLLRNTAFSGDYESRDVSGDMEVSDETETFSEKLKYWNTDADTTIISDDDSSMSGKAATIGFLSQNLDKPLLDGEPYTLSFVGKGTAIVISIGDSLELNQVLTAESKRYELHFINKGASDVVAFASDNATISDIMLSYGTIAPAWSPAYVDNDKSMAQFQSVKYLLDAINNGSTTIDGGVVMSQLLKVGNFRDKQMVRETGGMSGYYNDDNSPYLWGGGSYEQAIHTIQKYKDNPTFQPTKEELADMVNFVVTHGGRAILNDIILRGIIYAEGGVMKSIKSPNGNFEIDEEGNAKLRGHIEAGDGKVGGFYIDRSSLYYGDPTQWKTTKTANLAQMGWNFLRIAQAITYMNTTMAYQKIGIGGNANPTDEGDTDVYGSTALYIYRNLFTMDKAKAYKPAAIIISNNSVNFDIALRLGGGLQVHGGVIQSGCVMTFVDKKDKNLLDLSRGTIFTLRNASSESMDFFLPSLPEARQQLGIESTETEFCIPITVIAAANTTKFAVSTQLAAANTDLTQADGGRYVDNNGIWDYGNDKGYGGNRIVMENGDCWSFSLTFTKAQGYYIQILNKQV